MKKGAICMSVVAAIALVIALASMGTLVTTVDAFDQYQTKDATGAYVLDNCAASGCHTSNWNGNNLVNYSSLSAAKAASPAWPGSIHNVHRTTMLNGNCNACHGAARFPVVLNSSTAAAPFNQACVGCHGRAEPVPGDDANTGLPKPAGTVSGLGLRLAHERVPAMAGLCSGCHTGMPVAAAPENVLPPVFTAALGTNSGMTQVNDPCSPTAAGFEGRLADVTTLGLDNDGNGLRDAADSACAPVVPETGAQCFDGNDNDNDGLTDCADPGCAGAQGGPATTCGVGACANTGATVCQGGLPVDTCTPLPAGTEGPFGDATCSDQIDNDCDTFTDAADPNCVQQCVPQTEVCNNLDDDCDGVIDNGIAPIAITCGTGICQANGQRVCIGGQLVDQCTPGQPQAEVCNNLDDDCDGVIDNVAPTPTTCGVGACANTGQLICQNGAPVDTCTPLPAGTEGPNAADPTCQDGIDNDCDGLTDAADTGCPVVCVPEPEVCDGIDNDCNGLIDDGIAPVDITCGVGACLAIGQRVCVNGALQDQCTPLQPGVEGPFGNATCADGIDNDCDGLTDAADQGCVQCVPAQEVCDGVDNDCDGVIDNNIPATPTTCGVGACANTGELVCQNGQLVDTCTPLQPGVEGPFGDPTCADNIDNDCDTLVDVADPGCAVPPVEEACFDQVDNDGDGLVDCADPDCVGAANGACDTGLAGACATGQVQCVDGAAACMQIVFPQPEGPFGNATCADGIDNDCDGFIDAADNNCQVGDVGLKKLIVPNHMTMKVGGRERDRLINVQARVFGFDEDVMAMVTLTAAAGAGLSVEIDPASITKEMNEHGVTVFHFMADIACMRTGTWAINWTATIAGEQNTDPANDTLTDVTQVRCQNQGNSGNGNAGNKSKDPKASNGNNAADTGKDNNAANGGGNGSSDNNAGGNSIANANAGGNANSNANVNAGGNGNGNNKDKDKDKSKNK